MVSRNINYYVMDGVSSGRIKCTLANWTGLVYKIPSTQLDNCKEIVALNTSGVYFLFGEEGDDGKPMVYVGQANIRSNNKGLLNRLTEHEKAGEKEWYEAIVFTTSNNSFGATEISWLENKFMTLAKETDRYNVMNGNEPHAGNVTEEKQSELEEYVEYARLVMGVLGHKIFEPKRRRALKAPFVATAATEGEAQALDEWDFCIRHQESVAYAQRTEAGFVVLKGSKIRESLTPSCPPHVGRLRAEHHNRINNNELLEDVEFKSASTAAQFVTGSSVNGRLVWKNSEGMTLGDVLSKNSALDE